MADSQQSSGAQAIDVRFSRRQFVKTAMLSSALSCIRLELPAAPALPEPSQTPVYLSDLSLCRPSSALSRKANRYHWRLLDYETDSFKGVMLMAGQNTAAPEVTLEFNRKGWHAIYFGLRSYGGWEDETRLLARLKSESTFSMISHQETPGARNRLDDYFWKTADLTGEVLVLQQYCTQVVPNDPTSIANACNGAWTAYIKLVPLTEQEVKDLQEERAGKRTRRLFAHNDAWSYTWSFRPTTAAEIRREFEPFRDTDFSRIYWEGGAGDRMFYPTKIGLTPADDWIQDAYRVGDRLAAESWKIMRKKGIDPFRVALEYAREIGLEFHATYRVAGFRFPVPEDEWNTGGVYDKHPEWRGTDQRGRRTPMLSYAFPEVRKTVISFLKEMASYPMDGICLAYNRRPPLIEYEAPLVEGFKAKYGQDPRELDERDPRWLSYRARVLTEFMREVRLAMKETAQEQKRSRPTAVSAIVMSSEKENLYRAMDLKAWITEGLVDTIIPYTSVEGLTSSADSWLSPQDLDFFVHLTQGTSCKLAANVMPRQLSPEEYRRRAHAIYQTGVEHLFFWDTNARNNFGPSWTALRRLGHREELEAWTRAGSPRLDRPGSNLIKLSDWDLRYVTPG